MAGVESASPQNQRSCPGGGDDADPKDPRKKALAAGSGDDAFVDVGFEESKGAFVALDREVDRVEEALGSVARTPPLKGGAGGEGFEISTSSKRVATRGFRLIRPSPYPSLQGRGIQIRCLTAIGSVGTPKGWLFSAKSTINSSGVPVTRQKLT